MGSKDRVMQLQGLYAGLRNRSISKVEFVRRVRSLVGDHMIKMAVYKLQTTRAGNKLNRARIMKSNQQAPNAMNRTSRKKVPFAMLYPILEPKLDKDSAMQLLGQYARFMVNSISKEEFIQHMRILVGDHTLKMAVYKVATRPGKLRQHRKDMVPKVIKLYSFGILDCFSYFEVGVNSLVTIPFYLYICNRASAWTFG